MLKQLFVKKPDNTKRMLLVPDILMRVAHLPEVFIRAGYMSGEAAGYVRRNQRALMVESGTLDNFVPLHQRGAFVLNMRAGFFSGDPRLLEIGRSQVQCKHLDERVLAVADSMERHDHHLLGDILVRAAIDTRTLGPRVAMFMHILEQSRGFPYTTDRVRFLAESLGTDSDFASYLQEHSVFELLAAHPFVDKIYFRQNLQQREIDVEVEFKNGQRVLFEAKVGDKTKKSQAREQLRTAREFDAQLVYVRGFQTSKGRARGHSITLLGLETLLDRYLGEDVTEALAYFDKRQNPDT